MSIGAKVLNFLSGGIVEKIADIIDQRIADRDLAEKLKHDLQLAALSGQLIDTQMARDIIVAEAGGESWLQRSWRPITMLVFVGLVAAHWLGFTAPNLPESAVAGLLDIVQVGVGGYVIGRSAEKGIREWRSGSGE